ncbi:MAG: thioredoxin-dependent thiol peroxidase [Candidatus Heimdallarchaeota archaeon]|nr:thioredoxin-dependent thiol peroxidase [Candidatus Heimdallarchaeota archaeon]
MNVGDKFPDFSLPNQDNEIIYSKDLKGTKFVIFAYPRALTSGCTKESCSVRDHYQEMKDRGVTPFGISNDSPAKNKKFAEKHGFQYDLLCDESSELLTKIGAYGKKKIYGKTYTGTFRYTYIVDEEYKLRKIFKKVNTAEHAQEILIALDDLGL